MEGQCLNLVVSLGADEPGAQNFPNVYFEMKESWKRAAASYLGQLGPFLAVPGLIFTFFAPGLGLTLLAIGLFFSIPGPWLLSYATSGRVLDATPWFIGVKGVITAKSASARLYGGSSRGDGPMIMHLPTGTLSSVPSQGKFRKGDPELSEQSALNEPHTEMYSLIDTVSNTIYHFAAARPPTVCVYVGKEGGMGRYILCSENCGGNELHKEAVIRMPSYVQNFMLLCDWLAIGGMDSCPEPSGTAPRRADSQGASPSSSRKGLKGLLNVALVSTFLFAMSAVPVAA